MAKKFDLGKVQKQVRTQLEVALTQMGNEAKNHFVKSFRDGGFTDKALSKWKPRKDKGPRSQGRAVLVKSGYLRRSIVRKPINRHNLSVVISTDVPYAAVHNFGGIVNRRAYKRTATITRRVGGKKVTFKGKRHNVSASSFKMPKRQFIGDSYQLNEKIKKIIISNTNKAFNK